MPEQTAGPIDFVLLEFPEDADTKACADAIMDLVKRGLVRLFDILVIRKALDGSYSGMDLTDVTPEGICGFTAFAGAQSGLIHNDDVGAAVEVMQPGTMAALIVFENTWAAPFVGAVLDAGGEMIASQRIPALYSRRWIGWTQPRASDRERRASCPDCYEVSPAPRSWPVRPAQSPDGSSVVRRAGLQTVTHRPPQPESKPTRRKWLRRRKTRSLRRHRRLCPSRT